MRTKIFIGDWLEGSGCTSTYRTNRCCLGYSRFLSEGLTCDRTRHAHQVTACGWYVLMGNTHRDYLQDLGEGERKNPNKQWVSNRFACSQYTIISPIILLTARNAITIVLCFRDEVARSQKYCPGLGWYDNVTKLHIWVGRVSKFLDLQM